MTATQLVESEIARFLEGTAPEVLCVTGKWGVGKTFAWKRLVKLAQENNRIGLKRYSYVSLFGQNSLSDFKAAIFEETVDVGRIGKPFDITSTAASLKSAKSYFPRILGLFGKAIPGVGDYLGSGGQLLFLAVRNQIVCVDDLERAGDDLKTKDVLGLISFLTEERGCKVVLLLNEEKLGDEEKADFGTLLEKVVDIKLEFNPTPAEAAEIGIKKDTPFAVALAAISIKLGITNLRVITKIERLAGRLSDILRDFQSDVLTQAVQSVTIFGWAAYQPEEAPTLDFISKYNHWTGFFEKEEQPPEEAEWTATLKSVGFTGVDEFDDVILAGVKSGFFDEDALTSAATKLQAQFIHRDLEAAFNRAWQRYFRSFTSGPDDVLDDIAQTLKACVKSVSPPDLDATYTLFEDLGRPDQARELLALFMEERSDDDFDFSENHRVHDVKNAAVKAAFVAKAAKHPKTIDPKQALLRISARDGLRTEDIEALAKLSADDFVVLFKGTEGVDLPEMVKAALSFRTISNASNEMELVTANASEALRRIAAESPINARRVASYGIKPANGS